jgi:6-phosphogluconolactonase
VNHTLHTFEHSDALADALAGSVAGDLRTGVATSAGALLAVSGGTTPRRFFSRLSQQALDWKQVTVTLVDERWVAPDQDRSNERLLRETLLRGEAANAHFIPLYTNAASPELGLEAVATKLARLNLPFDAVVLGMGNDGHTASFFPGSEQLAAALDPQRSSRVTPIHAAAAGEPRMTLTLPILLSTRKLYLHIEGEAKKRIFLDAVEGRGAAAQYPIRRVLQQASMPLQVYWCP